MATSSPSTKPNDLPSRSPSPPLHPPVSTAPGPRATALQKLYSDAIAHVLKTCSYANFSACFPTLAAEVPGSLKLLHERFTEKLGEQFGRVFEEILAEREVVGSLNGLDGLIEEARRRKMKGEGGEGVVPPHTLPAQRLYHSHLAPSLEEYSRALRERQDAAQEENVELLGRVMRQRREIECLVKGLESVIGDLDASVATLQSRDANVEGLRGEVRDVDEDMRMTS